MSEQGDVRRKPVEIRVLRRPTAAVTLRRFDPLSESFDELTGLLHRAFEKLGAMGLNCTCVDQPTSVTQARAAAGECYVALDGARVVGTMTLYAPESSSRCKLYRKVDVASMRQFAVEPEWQKKGIGQLLLGFAEHWAKIRGYRSIALDTPHPAAHLIGFYRARGFRIVDVVKFDGKRYYSAVLCKTAVAVPRHPMGLLRLKVRRREMARAA